MEIAQEFGNFSKQKQVQAKTPNARFSYKEGRPSSIKGELDGDNNSGKEKKFSGNTYRPKYFSGKHSESENFSAIFPEIETTNVIFFVSLLLYESLFSGPLRSDFVILLLLLTARSRRTRKAD